MGAANRGITRARMSFIAEFKRRNVFRVGVADRIVAWFLRMDEDVTLGAGR
jgi:hypothetical protein